MNTTHNTKTRLLRLATAAVATPALLFAGAGTAQADTGDVSSPYDTGDASSPFDTGSSSSPLAPLPSYPDLGMEPHPAPAYEAWVPEESVSLPDDWGMPDVSTDTGPSAWDTLSDVASDLAEAGYCVGSIALTATACAPVVENPALGLTPIGGACAEAAVNAVGACEGPAGWVGDAASDIWDGVTSIPDSMPGWGPGRMPYMP